LAAARALDFLAGQVIFDRQLLLARGTRDGDHGKSLGLELAGADSVGIADPQTTLAINAISGSVESGFALAAATQVLGGVH
jgi:hypothetical protein